MAGGRLEAAVDRNGRRFGRFAERVIGDTFGGRAVVEARAFADALVGDAIAPKGPQKRPSRAVALDRNHTGAPLASEDRRTLSRGDGERLPFELEKRLGQLLGHDFSHVRIHTDDAAASTAERLGAKALTVGTHIFFNRGFFRPGTAAGDRLLVHELTHVVQHDEGRLPRGRGFHVTSPSDTVEREAKSAENKAASLGPTTATATPAATPAATKARGFDTAGVREAHARIDGAPRGAAPQGQPAARTSKRAQGGGAVAGDWSSALSSAWDSVTSTVSNTVSNVVHTVGEVAEEGAEALFRAAAPEWLVEFVLGPGGPLGYIQRRFQALIEAGIQALTSRFAGVLQLGRDLLSVANAFETAFHVLTMNQAGQRACCADFTRSITTIREFANKLIHNPAVDAVRRGFAALNESLGWLIRVVGGAFFDFLRMAIPAVWNAITTFVGGVVSFIGGVVQAVVDFVLNILAAVGLDLRGGGPGFLAWIERGLQSLWESIKRALNLDTLRNIPSASSRS